MISTKLIILMLGEYVVLACVACAERQWVLALYWFGACVLNIPVLIWSIPIKGAL
jgi:hypothetical protein